MLRRRPSRVVLQDIMLHAIDVRSGIVEESPLLGGAKVADNRKVGAVEILKTAGQFANRHMAREHTAIRTEFLNRIQNPGSDPIDRPKMHSSPKILTVTLGWRATAARTGAPVGLPFGGKVMGPARYGQDEVDAGKGCSHRRDVHQLRCENLKVANQAAALQRAEAAPPVRVGK